MKRIKVEDEIIEEPVESEDQKCLEFSTVSEHCHNTKVRETGISNKLESTISTCFITMLHLANDKNLSFKIEEDDFKIYKNTDIISTEDENEEAEEAGEI